MSIYLEQHIVPIMRAVTLCFVIAASTTMALADQPRSALRLPPLHPESKSAPENPILLKDKDSTTSDIDNPTSTNPVPKTEPLKKPALSMTDHPIPGIVQRSLKPIEITESPVEPVDHIYPIDLPTALRLADGQNPQIQFARERIMAAQADVDRADVLWLPDLMVGPHWKRHDGQIQDTRGEVLNVSRSSLFVGGGPTAHWNIADALFEPLAAQQKMSARIADSQAVGNDILLDVALAYWELVRANGSIAVANEAVANAKKLDDLAQSYLGAQKLKEADAQRATAELRAVQQINQVAEEVQVTASIRLARLLRLDPFIRLVPADRQALPISLIDPQCPPRDLAAQALGNRPELARSQALVGLAIEKMRQERYRPCLPSVLLRYNAGGFGGGRNGFFGDFDGRSDVDAALVWEFKNLGLGNRAARRRRESDVRQAQILEIAQMDRVVSEVAEAFAQMTGRWKQLENAQEAVAAAARSFELNWKLFTDGGLDLIRPIEVLQSAQALTRAQENYLRAVIDYNQAQFRLHWAMGYPVIMTPAQESH